MNGEPRSAGPAGEPARSPYLGAPVELATLPNGAVVPADTQRRLERTMYLVPTVDRPAPGVTVFAGGFLNLTVIEGDDGLILYDTGETLADGEHLLRQIRAFTDKPIAAIVCSHSHYVHGTEALLEGRDDVPILGHPRLNANLADGGSGSVFPEAAPLQTARTLQQFCHFLPGEGPDAPSGVLVRFGRSGQRPVNRPVHDGERLTIAGVELVCLTGHGSDTDDCLSLHLPGRGVVLTNLLWPYLPNLYTLRGSKFRDPRDWRSGLAQLRALDPEVAVTTHSRALVGRAAVRDALDAQIDALDLIHDQTMRGILRGLGPDALRGFVRLPAPLAGHPFLAEVYGEVGHYGPYLYQHALGWFDGDAASINPLPPQDLARRTVDAMGGAAAVLERTRAALSAREWAWAAQLAQWLHRIAPDDPDVREAKAQALEALGRATPAMTTRSWYLTQARALRGQVRLPTVVHPNLHRLLAQPPATSVRAFRVRVDPHRAGALDRLLAIAFTDRGVRHGLHLRRGVVRFVDDPDRADRAPDLAVALPFEAWLRYFAGGAGPDALMAAARVELGPAAEVRAFLGLFDAG